MGQINQGVNNARKCRREGQKGQGRGRHLMERKREGKSQKGPMKGGMERREEGKPWKIEGMRWRMRKGRRMGQGRGRKGKDEIRGDILSEIEGKGGKGSK